MRTLLIIMILSLSLSAVGAANQGEKYSNLSLLKSAEFGNGGTASQNIRDLSLSLFKAVKFGADGNGAVVDLVEIKKLLKNGADPNWVGEYDIRGETPLARYTFMSVVSKNDKTDADLSEAVSLLFKNGANVQNEYDGSILFNTISSGNHELTRILLYNGVSAKNWGDGVETKLTPVEYAHRNGFEDIVKLLVLYGAKELDINKAIQNKFIYSSYSENTEVLGELIANGASVNLKDDDNHTALINALGGRLDRNLLQRVQFLLDKGADPNLDGKGRSYHSKPLHIAVTHGKNGQNTPMLRELLNLLVDSGSLVSGRDQRDMTPLHWAAALNNPYAVQALIDRHSKVMSKDKYDKTPLDYAESSEVIKILTENGAKEL